MTSLETVDSRDAGMAPPLWLRQRFHGSRTLVIGLCFLATLVVLVLVVPWIASASISHIGTPLQAPSLRHLFGTDELGRDVFVRTMAAGRIDLGLAVAGVGASLVIGTLVGVLAAISGARWIESLLMRIVDAIIAFPFIVLVLVLVVLIGPQRKLGPIPQGLPAIFLALVATDWAWYARMAHAQASSVRKLDYVVAARLAGLSLWRVIWRHVTPSVVRVGAAYAVGDAILFIIATASLAFLGAGVPPPIPEWGAMMYEGQLYLQNAPWITLFPAAVLALTGVGASMVADSLLSGRADGR
jgi:peptide/nickel transport system permease protein